MMQIWWRTNLMKKDMRMMQMNDKVENKNEIMCKNITDSVLDKIKELTSSGGLIVPADYSPENALKSAWLIFQNTKDRNGDLSLANCSKASIINALLDMVVQGLSPSKKQCYFVPYKKDVVLMRSYMGTVAATKRFSDVKDVFASCIFEGDHFEYDIDPSTGLKKILAHTQAFENIDIKKIKGAYAVVVRDGAENYVEIMTMQQIRTAWTQGANNGRSPAHEKFTEEMAKKTVINRACKMFINTSSDQSLMAESFNRATEADYLMLEQQTVDAAPQDKAITDAATDMIFAEAGEIHAVD